jgi:hypothetical protein
VIRAALLLCYLTAVLSGPRPCCCAAPAPPSPEKPAAPVKKHTCPLCAAESKPEPKRSPAKKHHCPCPKAEVKAPTLARAGDDSRPSVAADEITPERSPDSTPDGVALVVVPGPPPDPSPHLTRLCHRLRC